MLRLTWTETGLEDLQWWADKDPRKIKRIVLSFPRGEVVQVFKFGVENRHS